MGESFISIFQQFFASINKIFVWGTLGYNSMNILDVPKSKSYVDLQLVRQLVYTMFITNNHASFHLWGKEYLVKYQKVSKHYVQDCLQNFLLLFMILFTASIVKGSHILAGIYVIFLKNILDQS